MPFFDLRWQDLPDIIIVAFIIYRVLMLLVGTRAMRLLRGVLIIGLIGALANILELRSLSWIIGKLPRCLYYSHSRIVSARAAPYAGRAGQGASLES